MEYAYYYEEINVKKGIATLGASDPGITCSQITARHKFPNRPRFGTASFEDAVELVKNGTAKFCLIPGAYPEIGKFLMDETLALRKVFKTKIPALVYGNVVNDLTASIETIFYHPAVTSLLHTIPNYDCGVRFVAASSNETAYESMMNYGERAGCVSNAAVFHHFGRPILLTLRIERDMSWHVFSLKPKSEASK